MKELKLILEHASMLNNSPLMKPIPLSNKWITFLYGNRHFLFKEKEIKKYGEYRTRRLVLEDCDRLAPSWDMETHLKRLKEVWEKYQVDLSGGKGNEQKQKSRKSGKVLDKTVEELRDIFSQPGLFDGEELI